MKWLFILLILLSIPLIFSFNQKSELVQPEFGNQRITASPYPPSMQIYYFGYDLWAPVVTLIAPFDNSEDSDGIVDFYYNVSDANRVDNCSLYLDGNYQTSDTSITRNTQQEIQVTTPPVNERLEWLVSCTDLFKNNGNSSTWHVKTQRGGESELGGGLGGLVNITEEEPEELEVEEVPEEKKGFPYFFILIFIFMVIGLLAYEKRKKLVTLFLLLEEKGKGFLENLREKGFVGMLKRED